MRRASSQDDDLVGEGSYGREQGPVAKGMGVTSGTDGKRIRVRSSVVSYQINSVLAQLNNYQ